MATTGFAAERFAVQLAGASEHSKERENAQAAENFKTAAPLLKADEGSYGRNQYWLGFALLNLKRNGEAREAFVQSASVNSPYKALAQAKLKTFVGASRH